MRKKDDCVIIKKTQRIRIDTMNRNTIISLSMLYALWQTERKDLLDLIRPFVMYAVGSVTAVGSQVNETEVCKAMEREFGYKTFQPAVIHRILSREAATTIEKDRRKIVKRSGHFFLVASLSALNEDFINKRTQCKAHTDAVTKALSEYLNKNNVYGRSDFSQEESERMLLSFFEQYGNSVILSVDDLRQIRAKDNENFYYIGKFILGENEKNTVLIDYIVELVKGYFVTMALYLQADNPNVTHASFSDVTFFLDTRILLAYLGYKTEEENNSVQEMIRSVKRSGAKLACFLYNVEEVNSILQAYKQSTLHKGSSPSSITLEYFDEQHYSFSHVDAAQRLFQKRLEDDKIECLSPTEALSKYGVQTDFSGLLDDGQMTETVLAIKPSYNTVALPEDLEAINTVSRIRRGKNYPYIEKSKAVFVTKNTVLIVATKEYLKHNSIDVGFPLVVSSEDLCVMAWLKEFEHDSRIPKMRLLENVVAATTPTRELMDAYYSNLENLEKQGTISVDEAALLRVDLYARKEMMERTRGNKDNLSYEIIEEIRNKLRAESRDAGFEAGRIAAEKAVSEKNKEHRNLVCKRAEEEVEQEYLQKEHNWVTAAKVCSYAIAALFLAATIASLVAQWGTSTQIVLLVVTAVTTVQAIIPFFSKDTWIIRWIHDYLNRKKLSEVDARKDKYLSLLDADE